MKKKDYKNTDQYKIGYKDGYKDGHEKTLDELGVLHGKDAARFLENIHKVNKGVISKKDKKLFEDCKKMANLFPLAGENTEVQK